MAVTNVGPAATAFAFSFSLSISTVVMPLLGLAVGYSSAIVGAMIAVSGVAQFLIRLFLGVLLRHVRDRTLVAFAGTALVASNVVPLVSTSVVPFVVAQVLQGAARACFWTGSQTHVMRIERSTVKAIAGINLMSAVAMLTGPYLAGVLIERDIELALALSAAVACVAVVITPMLRKLPLLEHPEKGASVRLWRTPGFRAGCWVSGSMGAWRGLLSSYFPILLEISGQSPATIGGLISVANLALLAGTGLLARDWAANWTIIAVATAVMGAGTVVFGFVAGSVVATAVTIALSGVGAGMVQTLGVAMARDAVGANDVGEVVIATGTFRAAALFAGPLTVAGAIGVIGIGLSVSLAVVGAIIALPALVIHHTERKDRG